MKRALLTAGFSLLLCGVGGTAYAGGTHPQPPTYSAPTAAHHSYPATVADHPRPPLGKTTTAKPSKPCATPTKTGTGVSSSPAHTSSSPVSPSVASSTKAAPTTSAVTATPITAAASSSVPSFNLGTPTTVSQDSPQLALTGPGYVPTLIKWGAAVVFGGFGFMRLARRWERRAH